MKCALAVILALLLGIGCTRPKQISKCMKDAEGIVDEVQEHRAVYGEGGQFATPLGQRSISNLFDRDQEMISSMASDAANRSHYREALDADDVVKSYRFLQFMLETEQMPEFARWEEQKQMAAVSVATGR
jgi:hypothetical protein